MGRNCTICVHEARYEIDRALAAGERYRNITERYAPLSVAAVSRHAAAHLPLHLSRAHDAREVAAADAIAERLIDAEAKMSGLFHQSVADGNVRAACAAVREIARLVELLARVGEALPRPVLPALQQGFTWPNGEVRDAVPLESSAEMAEHEGFVTSRRLALVEPEQQPVVEDAEVVEDDEPPRTLPDGTPYPSTADGA